MAVTYHGTTISNPELRSRLEQLSQRLGRDVIVHGGDRDPQRNARVHGVSSSQHLSGNAADISISGMSLKDAAQAAAGSGLFNGIGYYENSKAAKGFGAHVHVDVRSAGGSARWAVDKNKKTHAWSNLTTVGPMGAAAPVVPAPVTPPSTPPSQPATPEPPDQGFHEPHGGLHDFPDTSDSDTGENESTADTQPSDSEMETDPGQESEAPEGGSEQDLGDHPDVPIGGELGAGGQEDSGIDLDPAPDDPSDLESDPDEGLDLDPAPDDPGDLEAGHDSGELGNDSETDPSDPEFDPGDS